MATQTTDGIAYKHMYRQRGKILVRCGAHVVGTYHDVAAAGRQLAAHLGIPVANLPKRAPKNKAEPISGVRGIYRTGNGYEVRHHGSYIGRYSSKTDAAKALGIKSGKT